MNGIIKKIKLHIGSAEGLIFTLLSALLFVMQSFAHSISAGALRNALIALAACFALCPLVFRYAERFKLPNRFNESKGNKRLELFLCISPFIILIFQYIIYYPGGFSRDSYYQYTQAVTNSYDDWHPVLHTLLFFKLPLFLTNGWTGSIVLFQIILFSLTLAYTVKTLSKYINIKLIAIIIIWIAINPQTINLVLYPWKDIAFAMGTLLLTDFALNICFSKGEWIKNIPNTVAVILIISLTTIIRHNAILFTAPYLFALIFFISKKRAAVIILSAVVLFGAIKYPVYNYLHVKPAENLQEETLGLPLSVIDAVAAFDSDSLDEKTRAEIYRITPEKVLKENFEYSGYNTVKWNKDNNKAVIEEYGAKKILQLAFSCFKASPKTAVHELLYITSGGWGLINEDAFLLKNNELYFDTPAIDYKLDFRTEGIPALQKVSAAYTYSFAVIFPLIFLSLGIMYMAIIFVILVKRRLRSKEGLKRILFALPVFSYNFITMLLLSSAEDTIRFFYYTFLVTPLLLVMLAKKKQKL